MILHPDTQQALEEKQAIEGEQLEGDLEKLLALLKQYSPMSDIKYVLHQSGETFENLHFGQDKSSWMPVRNILRIIAMVLETFKETRIKEIEIESMRCGCDYFEGNLSVTMVDNQLVSGPYKWQWTAFPGKPRNFDRFTHFPKIQKQLTQNPN